MKKRCITLYLVFILVSITLFQGCITEESENNPKYQKNTFYVDLNLSIGHFSNYVIRTYRNEQR